jgi:hypothetical protein
MSDIHRLLSYSPPDTGSDSCMSVWETVDWGDDAGSQLTEGIITRRQQQTRRTFNRVSTNGDVGATVPSGAPSVAQEGEGKGGSPNDASKIGNMQAPLGRVVRRSQSDHTYESKKQSHHASLTKKVLSSSLIIAVMKGLDIIIPEDDEETISSDSKSSDLDVSFPSSPRRGRRQSAWY